MKKTITIALLGIFSVFKANAQATQVVDLSTGISDTAHALLPLYAVDDTWQTTKAGYNYYFPARCSSGNINISGTVYTTTWAKDPTVRWISDYVNTSGEAIPSMEQGDVKYKMTFTPKSCTVSDATINLTNFAGDNNVSSLSLNGHVHALSGGYGSLSHRTITGLGGEIISGTNTIIITVYNEANPSETVAGLLVNGNLTINYNGDASLVSHLTAPASVCLGSPITVDGSSSTGTAGDHVWTVVESDASGNAVAGSTEWWSPFYAGNAGSFTIPAAPTGPVIQCGKYYRVKLALQAPCDDWKEDFKVVYVNCLPAVNAGPDDTICSGDCITIGVGGRGASGVTYQWSNTGQFPAPGTKQVSVCPTTTTTYTLTATNASTGCTASDVVTIHVAPHIAAYFTGSSSFCYGDALTFNTTGSIGGANDYVWTVIECTSAGVPVSGGLVWWSPFYPGMPGIYTIPAAGAGGPAVVCGKYYEIKLALQNDCNVWAPYTKIIYIGCAPCGGNSLATNNSVYKNLAADAANAPELSVYPNPGKGIFNVELNTSDKTIMEVYDMIGNKIQSIEVTSHYQLDLSGYSKGIYMIKMTVNGQQVNKKIILE